MLKRSIALALACALLFQVCGCASFSRIPLHAVDEGIIEGNLKVTTIDGVSFKGEQHIALVRSQ